MRSGTAPYRFPSDASGPPAALIAAALVFVGLAAHVLIGFIPFPMGDDFAYGPLTWLDLHPEAYPRDEHLRLFADHAYVYALVYRLSLATIGVAEGFLVTTMLFGVLMVVAMYAVVRAIAPDIGAARRVGAVLIALALSALAQKAGVGRGIFGGILSMFFQHQMVSLVFALFACAAALGRQGAIAGVFLGLTAYAQPATAIQAAVAVGLGFLALGREGVRPLVISIAVSALVALPAVVQLGARLMADGGTEIAADVVIEQGYRFRAPHHYNLPPGHYLLWAGYLMLGLAAALVLRRQRPDIGRVALGLLAGGIVLFVLTFAVYALGYLQWPVLFMLDLNRTTPLFFALAGLFAVSAVLLQLRSGGLRSDPMALALPVIGLTLFLSNFTVGALVALIFGIPLALAAHATHRGLTLFTIATAAFVATALAQRELKPDYTPETAAALTWVRENTPETALFIIPVGLLEFRELSRRSAYVDFKAFSVAQPAHAVMTRNRMVEVAQPSPESLKVRGFPAVPRWEADQHKAATCAGMAELMRRTGAEYTVLRTRSLRNERLDIPDCADGPELVFRNEALAVFRG